MFAPIILILLALCAYGIDNKPPFIPYPAATTFPEPLPSNDVNLTFTLKSVVTPLRAAEYHCITGLRVFVISGSSVQINNTVHVYQITPSLTLENIGNLSLIAPGDTQVFGEPNSCTAFDNKVYIGVTPFEQIGTARGKLFVFDALTFELLDAFVTGYNPDHVLQNPAKTYVVVADEGEPPSSATISITYDEAKNPPGGVTILNLNTKATCSLEFRFNYTESEFRTNLVHRAQSVTNTSNDIEPEYIAFDELQPDRVFVVCQEANIIVEVLVSSSLPCTIDDRVVAIRPLGVKSYKPGQNLIVTSGKFVNGTTFPSLDSIPIFKNAPLFAFHQPDGMKGFTVNGQTYFLTANEGDSKDGDFGERDERNVEHSSIGKSDGTGLQAESSWAPYTTRAEVVLEGNMKGLIAMNNEGKNVSSGKFSDLYTFGGRGFSIWKFEAGSTQLVYDSGHYTEKALLSFMKTSSSSEQIATFIGRLSKKGSEPEGVLSFTTPRGRTIAGVSFERASAIFFYDVTIPTSVKFVGGVTHPQMMAPEGISTISASLSPSGKMLLVVNGEGDQKNFPGVHQRLLLFEMDISEESVPANTTQSPTTKSGINMNGDWMMVSIPIITLFCLNF